MRVPPKDSWLAFPEDVSRHLGQAHEEETGWKRQAAGRPPVQLASFVLPPVSRQAGPRCFGQRDPNAKRYKP